MSGDNGGLLKFTINNPKYLRGPSGPCGLELPYPGYDG